MRQALKKEVIPTLPTFNEVTDGLAIIQKYQEAVNESFKGKNLPSSNYSDLFEDSVNMPDSYNEAWITADKQQHP